MEYRSMAATDYIGEAASKTNSILAAPIVGNVDTVHLFLVVGIFMLAALAWGRILAHMKAAV
jgi:hypothetical protein